MSAIGIRGQQDVQLTLLVNVRLNVPVGIGIAGLVVLGASNLNLLEAPLREVDIPGTKIATQNLMLQPDCRGKGTDLTPVT